MMSTPVTVQDYIDYRAQGHLIVRGLVSPDEVRQLLEHVDETRLRVHMLHRVEEIHERFLLHPRILDVVQALIGPDVLALQTMLFSKRPGEPGQGYHQDSFHILTFPDTLIGAWVALDRADEENGCLWITPGSQHEPVYPDADETAGHGGDHLLADIRAVAGADDPDERRNDLSRVAAKYGREVPAVLDPGDVVFFGGRVLHRSHANRSAGRLRRSFVAHYCNARSFVPWDDDLLPPDEMANGRHILARGTTHLPCALPKFGTAANVGPVHDGAAAARIGAAR